MSYEIPIRAMVEKEIKNIVEGNKADILKEIISCIPLDNSDDDSKIKHMYAEIDNNADQTQDDYHTMEELYDHRTVLFALVVSRFPEMSWKSYKHSDGTSENGWFIAGMETPYGQITYHQKSIYWNLFHCRELDQAPQYDGHSSKHVLTRLSQMVSYKE